MRRWLWFILALSPVAAFSQSSCIVTGNVFYESFNQSNDCIFGTMNVCHQPGVIFAGTSANIVPSPAGAPWCNNALEVSSTQVDWTNTWPTIPSGTTFDLNLELWFKTMPGNFANFIVLYTTAGSRTVMMSCFLASSTTMECQGSTASATVTVALNTSYLVHVHIDAVAANSYFQINGGATKAFTANALATDELEVGSGSGDIEFGNIAISSPSISGSFPPSLLFTFSGGNGVTVTNTTILSDMHGGNGDNTVAGFGAAGLTYSNTIVSPTWLGPVTLNGTSYTNNTGTSLLFDCTTNTAGTINFSQISPIADMQGWIYVNLLATDVTDYDVVAIEGGADLAIMHIKGTGSTLQWSLEYDNNGSPTLAAARISFSPLTLYWYNLDFRAGSQHTLNIFNASGTLLGSISAPANTPVTPTIYPSKIIFGYAGAGNCPATDYWLYGGAILNYSGIDWSPRGPLSFVTSTLTGGNTMQKGGTFEQ